jgi:phenylacetate-CoA ligase
MALYQRLVRDLFTPLSLWRAGELAQLRHLREFEQTQFLSVDELRDLQNRRLKSLLRHAYDSCPFYRVRFEQSEAHPDDIHDIEDLRILRPLEKAEIQEQGEQMIARNWPEGDLIRNQTGGSTGTPITFYLSGDRKCSRAAATLRHNRWAGWEVGDRAAVIWGAPLDRPANTWRSRLRGLLLAEPLWLDTASLTEETMRRFHAEFHRYRPQIVQAYARSAVLFARFLESENLSIPHVRSVITSAEVLSDDDRAVIERVFGAPVFNRYGCREVSVLASECPAHSGLHVMAEGLLLEIDTPTGPAGPGELGSILVTDLLNPAMPLIRYRIGDMAAWAAGTCSCGRSLPRLERIAGRVTDFLVGGDGRLVSGVYLATYVVAHRPSLGQVQLVQDRAGHVVYRLRPGPGFNPESDRLYLEDATRKHMGDRSTSEVEIVAEFPVPPSGKFLFSRSTVAPSWLSRA